MGTVYYVKNTKGFVQHANKLEEGDNFPIRFKAKDDKSFDLSTVLSVSTRFGGSDINQGDVVTLTGQAEIDGKLVRATLKHYSNYKSTLLKVDGPVFRRF